MSDSVRILLADDDEYDVLLTRRALEASGASVDVRSIGDGIEVLDYLHRRRQFAGWPAPQPALVLLDLKMPRADGFEVLSQVKGDAALRVIPIVVLTSSRQPRDLLRAYELGANGYVVKAMDFGAYVETLRGLHHYWLDINEVPPICQGRTER